jgi:hypothetical protein
MSEPEEAKNVGEGEEEEEEVAVVKEEESTAVFEPVVRLFPRGGVGVVWVSFFSPPAQLQR